MNVVDFLDIHVEEFNRVTHGGVVFLNEVKKIFRHITNDKTVNQYYLNQ